MKSISTDRQRLRTRRRQLGFAGLLVGCIALVEVKAATAPATHRITLGPSTTTATAPVQRTATAPSTSVGGGARPASRASVARSATGRPIDIGYGIVQVRIVLQGTRITDVVPLQLPSGGRSGSIASYAVPQLRSEVLAAQSPNIDTVSGASYTSEGYARSLQSALDAARS